MEAAPIFRFACPGSVGFCSGQPALLVGHVHGPRGTRLEHQLGDDAAGNRGDRAGSESRTRRSRFGILVGTDACWSSRSLPGPNTAQESPGRIFGEPPKPPFLSGLLAGAAGLLVKPHARWLVATNPSSVVGLEFVLGIYAWVLLIVMKQKQMYMDVLSQLLPRPEPRQERPWNSREAAVSFANRKWSRTVKPGPEVPAIRRSGVSCRECRLGREGSAHSCSL